MNKTICSPNIALKFDNSYTCFTLEELIKIAKLYNDWIKSNKIICHNNVCHNFKKTINLNYIDNNNLKYGSINYSDNINIKQTLWNDISNMLFPLCETDESCWVELDFLKYSCNNDNLIDKKVYEKLKMFTFKPKKIYNKRGWLTTDDINNVLQQYERVDKNFKFIGALPSDFYKIQMIDLKRFKNYKKIAIVFNLDGYTGPGSHWVSLYIDKDKKTIEYFDSTGGKPNTNIKYYINNILFKNFSDYKYLQNNFRHQLLDTECGVYSIYYIVYRILGFSFEYITSNVVRDHVMKTFREYIFLN